MGTEGRELISENWTVDGFLRTERIPHFGGDIDNQAGTTDLYLRLSRSALTLANSDNDDIALDHATLQVIAGPSAAFTVSGFTPTADGRLLFLFNGVAQAMTIENENAGSTAANRITTLTGADIVLRSGTSFAVLIYNGGTSRWVVAATN